MRIGGLQKLSLLDYPEKLACVVFSQGCNLRCPFCHNASLVLPQNDANYISEEAFFDFLKSRQGLLDGVCVSGGEPTIHKDLKDFLTRIRALNFTIKLDTNGTNPQVLQELLDEGLVDYVAMDIKNGPSAYAQTCGGFDVVKEVEQSIRMLMESSLDYEFRTTVCAPFHTQDSMRELGLWIKGAKRYYLQAFQDSGSLLGTGVSSLTQSDLKHFQEMLLPYLANTKIR
ncbi:MAG: anaerobic ribonucleoside-triphosphate reductase activating protein [Coriobacteriia bacterium]|nr:anaerobic ribonucleoside-triphosphate reductase activating protein [Coriobacteriia bacterium]